MAVMKKELVAHMVTDIDRNIAELLTLVVNTNRDISDQDVLNPFVFSKGTSSKDVEDIVVTLFLFQEIAMVFCEVDKIVISVMKLIPISHYVTTTTTLLHKQAMAVVSNLCGVTKDNVW